MGSEDPPRLRCCGNSQDSCQQDRLLGHATVQVATAQHFSQSKKQLMETNTLTLGPGCPFSPLSPCKGRGGRGQHPAGASLHHAHTYLKFAVRSTKLNSKCIFSPTEAGVPSTAAMRLMELWTSSVLVFSHPTPCLCGLHVFERKLELS